MAAIAISRERIAIVEKTIHDFIAGFLKPITEDPAEQGITKEEYLRVFHPDLHWFDHAFLICRQGHDAAVGLQKAFYHCNQPFNAEIKAIMPTATGAVLEQVWVGRCSNDIVRPDGQIAVKASEKDFKCHVCMIFDIDQSGKIRRIDEYYNKRWDDGIHETEYAVLKGASLRE